MNDVRHHIQALRKEAERQYRAALDALDELEEELRKGEKKKSTADMVRDLVAAHPEGIGSYEIADTLEDRIHSKATRKRVVIFSTIRHLVEAGTIQKGDGGYTLVSGNGQNQTDKMTT